MRSLFYIFLLMLILSIGCRRHGNIAESLEIIGNLCDTDPLLAVSMLDSIDSLPMSGSQRHLFDFLTVKSRDKAYIRHTSDSLILDVIDYYSSRNNKALYAEALYY